MPIAPDQISLIVQGPVGHKGGNLDRIVESARRLLPGAQLILSSWKGSDHPAMAAFDAVVLSDDPGPSFREPVTRRMNNVARQALSTHAGLMAADRPYAIKLRSDFSMSGLDFLAAWESFQPPDPNALLFERPIVTLSRGTIDPVRAARLFHPSDFFHFGLRSDLLRYWNYRPIAIAQKRALTAGEKLLHPVFGPDWARLAPEQDLFLSFLCANTPSCPPVQRMDDLLTADWFSRSEQWLLNSFLLLDDAACGLVLPERLARLPILSRNGYDPAARRSLAAQDQATAARRFRAATTARRRAWFSILPVYAVASILIRGLGLSGSTRLFDAIRAYQKWLYRKFYGIRA